MKLFKKYTPQSLYSSIRDICSNYKMLLFDTINWVKLALLTI